MSQHIIEQHCILSRQEMAKVLDVFRTSMTRHRRLGFTVFRLSACCGLRSCEIINLRRGDVVTSGPRPMIRIRPDGTKRDSKGRGHGRVVPLWWDEGTRDDLADWVNGLDGDTVIGGPNGRLARSSVARRWDTVMRNALGKERASQLSIHCGRHTFISHALHSGKSVVEVMRAAGHRSLASTTVYSHINVDEEEIVGNMFKF